MVGQTVIVVVMATIAVLSSFVIVVVLVNARGNRNCSGKSGLDTFLACSASLNRQNVEKYLCNIRRKRRMSTSILNLSMLFLLR